MQAIYAPAGAADVRGEEFLSPIKSVKRTGTENSPNCLM